MALREKRLFKRITASGGGTLAAPANRSYRVVNVFCVPSSNDTYLTFSIDSANLLKLRVKGMSGNRLPYPARLTTAAYEAKPGTVFDLARRLGKPMDLPIESGQTLTISRYAETGDITIEYEAYDPGDIKAMDDNGTMSKVRRYLHPISNAAAITATPAALADSLLPTGSDTWPVSAQRVGAGIKYLLLAILGAPAGCGNATVTKGATTYLQLLLDGDTLFAEDTNGLPFVGDITVVADAPSYAPIASVIGPQTAEYPDAPFVLDPPLEFGEGVTLTPQVAIVGAAATGFAADEIDVALLLERVTA